MKASPALASASRPVRRKINDVSWTNLRTRTWSAIRGVAVQRCPGEQPAEQDPGTEGGGGAAEFGRPEVAEHGLAGGVHDGGHRVDPGQGPGPVGYDGERDRGAAEESQW